MSTRDLTRGSIGRELVALAWPILCSSALAVLDATVNVMWVGRELGDVAVAALSNANLLWTLLFAGQFGVSMAGAIWIARSLGEGNVQDAKAALVAMVSTAGLISVLCVVPMMGWARTLLGVLGTPSESLAPGVQYLRVLLLSVPLTYLNGAVTAGLQAAGDSKTGFYISMICVTVDAVLNPVFIIGVGPVSSLGIVGAALATVASQAVGLAVLTYVICRGGHALSFRGEEWSLLRLDLVRAATLVRGGVPMAIQFLWASIEDMLMISLVNRFGADTTAAYGVTIQLWNVIMMPAAALGVAMTAMVAQNIGAGRWGRVQKTTRLGLAFSVVVTAMLVALAEILGNTLYRLFLPAGSPALVLAQEINHDATWAVIIVGTYTAWIGVLRARGAVWAPLMISAAVLAVRFPMTVALLGTWQAEAIWWSFPASAVATTALAIVHRRFWLRTQWESRHGIQPSRVGG
jgi:putative MATE family efflux protein